MSMVDWSKRVDGKGDWSSLDTAGRETSPLLGNVSMRKPLPLVDLTPL